ncbi:Uma2 family endonuclease [Tundrisphaera sp. TA3]|uniref:Uma2 family endonuclease n=1 Tax=Tundrisphaera sp. TA3 TaxID=3435775 RepID=UPI003EB73FFA
MSIVYRTTTVTQPPLIHGQRLDQPTFHDRYLAMPEDVRAELVGGVVYMMSALRYCHGDLDGAISLWIQSYRRRTPGLKSPVNVTTKLGIDAEVQPDCMLHIREDHGGQARVINEYLVGAPELVVEIGYASRAYDLGPKKDQYERSGVLEYLFVGVDPDQVLWFARRDGRFEPISPAEDGTLRSRVFPGLWLDPAALYADDLDALIAPLDRGMATPEHAAFADALRARKAGP